MLAKCEISNIELLLLVVISVDEELVWEFVVGTGIAEDLSLVKYSVYTMLSESCQRMVIVGYGRCFADRQNLMVCLRSMPNVFTGSCARMRCCLSENLLYRHRNGHIQAEWP